jgi:ribosomal protein S20
MIKKIIFLIITAFMFSCAGGQKVDTKTAVTKKAEKETVLGWVDNDTYTVKAQGKNIEKAKDKAINKIFREIVNVRVLNKSPYSDIKNIMAEFKQPIENGKVISEKQIQDGVEINFQIYEKDLKKKFERK